MPKHVPTFKHLINTSTSSSSSSQNNTTDRSVNERLASSRRHRQLENAPVPDPSTSQARVWVPNDCTIGSVAGGITDATIHPAELLRRSQIARRNAARTVAGPVPPPSWRTSGSETAKSHKESPKLGGIRRRSVTTNDLLAAEGFFERQNTFSYTTNRKSGTEKLMEYCLRAVLSYLEDSTPLYCLEHGFNEEELENLQEYQHNIKASKTIVLGEAMRDAVSHLDPHLKISLLDMAAILPESSTQRLSDQSIRAILYDPIITPSPTKDPNSTSKEEMDDWFEETNGDSPIVHHHSISLSANPLSTVRQIATIPCISLTSLNLAYSTIKDLEKLVGELPVGLRELGLVGVRPVNTNMNSNDFWEKGLKVLGRKFIVLKSLDLSYPSLNLTPPILFPMLMPHSTKLPSLTKLGLRGIQDMRVPNLERNDANMDHTEITHDDFIRIVRSPHRGKWIDVIWE